MLFFFLLNCKHRLFTNLNQDQVLHSENKVLFVMPSLTFIFNNTDSNTFVHTTQYSMSCIFVIIQQLICPH